MRASTRRKTAAICALVLLTALVGCSTPAPPPEPTATPTTAAPIFETDAEALAAATEAYAAFSALVDTIFQDGGAQPERIRSVASERLAQSTIADFESVASEQIRSTGTNRFDSVTLYSLNESAPEGIEVVTLHLCLDVSASDVVDATGISVAPPTRRLRTSVSVAFDWSPTEDGRLLVGAQDILNSGDSC